MAFATEDTITEMAVERWNTAREPRLREIMTALVRHLHAFARETALTQEEWLAGIEYITALGRISDSKRQEAILASDVFGLSMLVVMINARTPAGATPNTVLGPFHIEGSPDLPIGGDLSEAIDGTRLYVHGTVRSLDGQPIAGALLDLWQADSEGSYETQLDTAGPRLRAIQRTGSEGEYGFWTIAPKGYSIPMDGPVGALIGKTAISHYRPAHIHFLIEASGYQPLITHIFEEGARYIDDDAVFGAITELVTPFTHHAPGRTPAGEISASPFMTVRYDFMLVPLRDQPRSRC